MSAGNPMNALMRLAQRVALTGPITPGQGGPNRGFPMGNRGGARGPMPRPMRGPTVMATPGQVNPALSATPPNSQLYTPTPANPLTPVYRPQAPPPTTVAPSTSTLYHLNTSTLSIGSPGVNQSAYGNSLRPVSYAALGGSFRPLSSNVNNRVAVPSSALAKPGALVADAPPVATDAAMVTPGSGGMGGGGRMAASDETMLVDPDFVPMPYDMLEGAVLNAEAVATLKSAAADLVANHTLGADAAKDKAAVDAFQGVLDDLALSIWTQVNVTSTSAANALKDATATFADSYTGGTDLAKDKAAWKAFNTAMSDFTRSIRDPKAPPTPQPDGPIDHGSWMNFPSMWAGGSLRYLTSGLLENENVNKDDLAGVRAAIDNFANAYTSGADRSKDLTAGESLLNEIGMVMSKHWERLAPPELRDMAVAARSALAALPTAKPGTVSRDPVTVAMGNAPTASASAPLT